MPIASDRKERGDLKKKPLPAEAGRGFECELEYELLLIRN